MVEENKKEKTSPMQNVPVKLIEECQRGDKDAYEKLFSLISRDLYRLIYSYMRNEEDTNEVLQETLTRIFRHIKGLKSPEKFAAWAARISVNQCNTYRTKRSKTALYSFDEELESKDDEIVWKTPNLNNPRESLLNKEIREDINRAIAQLPPRQRLAIILFELEGNAIKEIAERLNCSEGAVKFNIHQARKKLRKLLKNYL